MLRFPPPIARRAPPPQRFRFGLTPLLPNTPFLVFPHPQDFVHPERETESYLVYSDLLLDHFRNPRHPGVLDPPAIVVDAENPACGDWLRLSALIEHGKVVRATFQVKGCTASIGCGSALAEWLHGKTLQELRAGAREVVRRAIEEAVGELPPASRHAAELCADGVAALLEALSASASPDPAPSDPGR